MEAKWTPCGLGFLTIQRGKGAHTCVSNLLCDTCVRHLDSHVKGDKCVRGVRSVKGVGSVNVPHTCVSTHLGLKGDLAK